MPTEDDIRDFALEAPDMWAWRKGVIDFSVSGEGRGDVELSRFDLGGADLVDRQRRMKAIETYLADHPGDQISHANLLHELGQIKRELGQIDDALGAFDRAIAYDIFLKLDLLDDEICHVGLTLGKLLCSMGQIARGLEVLRRSEQGFLKLGNKDMVQKAQKIIDSFPART